jgi:hypothetical protein
MSRNILYLQKNTTILILNQQVINLNAKICNKSLNNFFIKFKIPSHNKKY